MTERHQPVHGDIAARKGKPRAAEVVATICRRSGQHCPAAMVFIRQVLRAAELATAAAPEFEMTGATTLAGCAQGCPALFRLSAVGVDVFCGVGPDADADALARFATGFLEARAPEPLPPPGAVPLALLRVPAPPIADPLCRVS